MDPKESREQLVRDAKSGLILDAARKMFAEKGFHETRLEDIAAAAGFSKAALYNYYNDKESIFLSLANRDFEKLFEAMKNILDPQAKFLVNLESIIRTVLSFFGEHFAFMLASANFRTMEKECPGKISEYHGKLFGQFNKKFSHIIDLFCEVVREGKKRGEIQTELDERTISTFIESLIRGVIFQWKVQGQKDDTEQEIKQLMMFFNKGLNIRSVA